MKVRYSKRAVADLIGIADYIREHNPRAAKAVERRIRAAMAHREMFPLIGRPTDAAEIRMFPIVRYPYLIYYEVVQDQIVVHRIRHARRRQVAPGGVRSE